jgi:hypothetical protein
MCFLTGIAENKGEFSSDSDSKELMEKSPEEFYDVPPLRPCQESMCLDNPGSESNT